MNIGRTAKMADLIYHILDAGHIGIVEAGTGTGKSLAYLYPALCFALARVKGGNIHEHN